MGSGENGAYPMQTAGTEGRQLEIPILWLEHNASSLGPGIGVGNRL
jgi:hypothetical protein